MKQAQSENKGVLKGSGHPKKDRLWPLLITAGLALVVLVNAIFIYLAVSGADDVVPSYLTEER